MCVSNPVDIFKPHKWFKAPKIDIPQIVMPDAPPAAPPVAPLKVPKIAKSTGTTDIRSFSQNLSPTLTDILGLSIPKMPPGLKIPGVN
jgi:hypothetical protein